MKEASELLEAGKPELALSIGRQMEKHRFSGGFEIQALAYRELGDTEKAIQVLRQGTECVPDVWVLWNLLGNYLSDEGSFDEALTAYDAGIDRPNIYTYCLRVNRANVVWRMKRLDEADADIEALLSDTEFATADPDLKLYIHGARIGILNDLGRHKEAITYFESLADNQDWIHYPAEASRIESKYATALWHDGRVDEASSVVRRAVGLDKSNEDAQWLIREIRRQTGEIGSQSFELMIHGPWLSELSPECAGCKGFYSSYSVVAETLDEALAFVREFEPKEIRDALEIDEVKHQEPSDEPKGVYWTSGYSFYSED